MLILQEPDRQEKAMLFRCYKGYSVALQCLSKTKPAVSLETEIQRVHENILLKYFTRTPVLFESFAGCAPLRTIGA